MLYVDNIAEIDRLVSEPLAAGRPISIDGFLDLLALVTIATNGQARKVSFRGPNEDGGRPVSRSYELSEITPVEVSEKVGEDGLTLLGRALAGNAAAAWTFRRRLVNNGPWDDIWEANPHQGRYHTEMAIFSKGDTGFDFALCSPLMASSTLAYIWATLREFQDVLAAQRDH